MLLWLTLAAFSFKSTAQTTPNCNAWFEVQYLTQNTVKFNPAITTDSPFVRHFWNFGDGTIGSQLISPTHTYALPGTYAVVHTVLRVTPNNVPVCTQTFTKQVTITAPCNLVANFSWSSVAANPLTIAFQNLSAPLSNTDSIKWTFGDGTSSTAINPIHIYNAPGTYTVCLRVKKSTPPGAPPCVREICKTITIAPPCNIVPNFTWAVTPTNPLRIEFNNTSTNTAATDSIRWTFGDGASSNQVNPAHIYNVPGTYTVCLRIIRYYANTTTPCIREICKTIVVQSPCTLVVNFTSQPDPNNPLRIKFTNTSTPIHPADSVRWTFGDGSSVSGLQSDPNIANPTHVYTQPGNYNICLRVKKNSNIANTVQCVREFCRTITVYPPCNLVVNFTSQPDPNNPLRIKFNNTSVPVMATDSLFWSFGDSTILKGIQGDPNIASPIHNYSGAGTYNVCLIVKKHPNTTNTPCIKYSCRSIVVYQPCNLVVNFTSQPDPAHPLRIKFTNTSTPIHPADSVRWTFGDGSSVSGLQSDPTVANPTHIYANAGTYSVCLRIKKNNNATTPVQCIRDKCTQVVVTNPCNFPINFSWRLDSVNTRKVHFTNLSIPPVSGAIAVWNFGDGNAATSWNAVHEYAQPGRYIVCLRVYLPNSNCVLEKCDTLFIPNPPPPCNQLSKYQYQVFPNDNQKYKFTPDYINNALQYTWTFGDGTGSHDPVAVHRYTQPGVYVACLTVWRGPECASTTCKEIRVLPQINCDTAHAWYTYQRNPNIPNKIQFTAHATIPIIDQVWYITKVSGTVTIPPVILHQNNPVYVFQDTGLFKVCLKAKLDGGCVKEYCSNIRIEQVANACELQAFPNPASFVVNVNLYLTQPELILATVYNSLNLPVLTHTQQGHTGNNLVTLPVSSLIAGQYTIRLVYGNRVCYARFQKL